MTGHRQPGQRRERPRAKKLEKMRKQVLPRGSRRDQPCDTWAFAP